MNRKSDNIARFSEDELMQRHRRGESLSDWAKASIAPMPDGSDPDDAMEPVDWATTVLPSPPRNLSQQMATVQIDADVVQWFKAQGRGYRDRINDVLRSYVQQHSR